MTALPLTGGCLCGAIRYEATAAPESVVHCHCRMCRLASGAPVTTWATVPRAAFHVVKGSPIENRSSKPARRLFCGDCGSQLAFLHDEAPNEIDITWATLDDPEAWPPLAHIWTASRLHAMDDLGPGLQSFLADREMD